VTRVILTNKKTGQSLPGVELVSTAFDVIEIRFDGTIYTNAFNPNEWDYREVRTFRNGDVLRRKDRDDLSVRYMFVVNVHDSNGRWLSISADGSTHDVPNPSVLNDPEWELV